MPTRRKSGGRRRNRTRRRVPWAGWGKQEPKGHQRTVMYKKCGKKCFLGPPKRPHPSFPICTKGTCRVNTKGVYAAYVRAKQWGKRRSHYKGRSRPSMKRKVYTRVARKANSILKRRHVKRGGTRTRRGGRCIDGRHGLRCIRCCQQTNGGPCYNSRGEKCSRRCCKEYGGYIGGKKTRKGGKGRKGKCLVGQRRNKAGKIVKHGHYKKC